MKHVAEMVSGGQQGHSLEFSRQDYIFGREGARVREVLIDDVVGGTVNFYC